MNLGLHNPEVPAQFLGGGDRVSGGGGSDAGGHLDAVGAQKVLGLILVQLHGWPLSCGVIGECSAETTRVLVLGDV